MFIPKHSEADSAAELRPITISSLLVRTYSHMLLGQPQEDHPFHELQSGFSQNKVAQSNLLLLQELMRDAKCSNRPFYAASLDLLKAIDSMSHHALLTALDEGRAHEAYVSSVRDLYLVQSTMFSYRGVTDGVRV